MAIGEGIPESDFISRKDFGKIVDEADFDDFKGEFEEDVSIDDFKKQIEDFNFEKSKKNPEDFLKKEEEQEEAQDEEEEVNEGSVQEEQEEEQEEAQDEEDGSAKEDDAADDGDKKHKVKVDGQEYEVTLDELIKAYQLDAHITKKSQEVSKNIKESQEIFNRVVAYNDQVKDLEAKVQAEHEEWLAEHLDEDEAREYRNNIENRKKQEQVEYSSFINSSMAELLKIHPDAGDLDTNEDFIAYRQEVAPMVQPQHVAVFGPLALAPLMSSYKKVLELKKQLDEAKVVSSKKVEEAKKREAEQREKKKKSQTMKPNSSSSNPKKDEPELESDEGYLKRMQGRRGNRGLLDI